jgi:hypothetical protein
MLGRPRTHRSRHTSGTSIRPVSLDDAGMGANDRQPQAGQGPVPPAANSSRPPVLAEQLRERVSDVHDLIQISGPFACTIAELLVRLGEPEATLEARARVERALAENHVRTSPMLTVARLRADSVIALTLQGSASTKRVGGTLERPANAVPGETKNGERISTAAVLSERPAELTSRMVIDDELRLPNGALITLQEERAKVPPSAGRASLATGSTIDGEQQPGPTAGVPPAIITQRGYIGLWHVRSPQCCLSGSSA